MLSEVAFVTRTALGMWHVSLSSKRCHEAGGPGLPKQLLDLGGFPRTLGQLYRPFPLQRFNLDVSNGKRKEYLQCESLTNVLE